MRRPEGGANWLDRFGVLTLQRTGGSLPDFEDGL
jgi:hypothetical protein